MIKGVNKRIIEINNPESIYFEKAVFYLRSGVRELPGEVSSREVQRYTSMLGLETQPPKHKRNYGRMILTAMSLLSAAALVWVFLH